MPARSAFPRTLGVLTAGYGAYTLLRPASLPRAARLEPATPLSPTGRALAGVVGWRDLLSGLAMTLAPSGALLRAAVAARVAADAADVAAFGAAAPSASKARVVAVAAAWGALSAASWSWAGAGR